MLVPVDSRFNCLWDRESFFFRLKGSQKGMGVIRVTANYMQYSMLRQILKENVVVVKWIFLMVGVMATGTG